MTERRRAETGGDGRRRAETGGDGWRRAKTGGDRRRRAETGGDGHRLQRNVVEMAKDVAFVWVCKQMVYTAFTVFSVVLSFSVFCMSFMYLLT